MIFILAETESSLQVGCRQEPRLVWYWDHHGIAVLYKYIVQDQHIGDDSQTKKQPLLRFTFFSP